VEAYDRYGTLGQILAKLTVSPACRRVAPGPAEVAVTSLPSRDTWAPQLERLVGAYRMIGARSAQVLQLQSIELSERLTQATVRWRLLDGAGRTLYDFDAAYTLADLGRRTRITAIAHNETARLRACVERQRSG